MPTYEYACRTCGEHLEVVQSFTDEALTECPACHGTLRKVFGNIGIAFKGSGFYKNDSRPAQKSDSATGESKSGDSATGESKSGDSKSGDSKSGDSKSDSSSSDKKSDAGSGGSASKSTDKSSDKSSGKSSESKSGPKAAAS